jgi:transketolase
MTPREQFAATATALLDEDQRLALVWAEISGRFLGDAVARHPDRVVNVGIREQLLVGVGAGMALTGLRPLVHTFGSFLVERAFEQVKLDFGHQGVGGVLVGSGGSFDMAGAGRTHQSPGDVALLDTLDCAVHAPRSTREVDLLVRDAAAADGLHYVRVSDEQDRTPLPRPSRRLEALRRGTRATVVVLGPGLDAVLAATAGMDVTVAHTATVRPFDAAGLRAVLATPDVVLVEPWLAGTSSRVVADALRDVPHRLLALGVGRGELRRYGTATEHRAAHGLDAAGLRRSITGFLRPAG